MTLLKISGDGIENNAITNAHLHSSAQIAGSKLNLVSTDSVAGLIVKGDGTTDGYLQLNCSQNSHGIKLKSPAHSASQSYTLTFPEDIQNAKFLTTDANGNLSWGTPTDTNTQLSNAQVRAAVEAASDSNVFTDADHSKLNGIEASATADQTASEIKTLFNSSGLVNAQIDASAAIAGTKISPDFGSQAITTTGNCSFSDLTLENAQPSLILSDNNAESDFALQNRGGVFTVRDIDNNANRFQVATDGTTTVAGNLDCSSGVDVTGNITVSGTVDGRDLATDGSKLDGIASGATNVTNNNQLTNGAGYITSASLSGVNDGGNAASLDGIDSSQFVRNDQNTTITADLFINGGAGGLTINDASDIRFPDGGWTGNTTTPKLNAHGNRLYIVGGTDGIIFRENATDRWKINGNGHFDPQADNTYDIGESNSRVKNVYAVAYYGDGSNLSGLVAFPSGTRMIFQQTSAPTGWTKDTSDTNQRALRVVSGSASSGGSVDFTTAFASKGVSGSVANGGNNTNNGGNNTNNATAGGSVNNHTLSTGRMPSHRHIGGAKGIHDAANGQYGTISNVGNLEYPLVRYTNGYANYDLYYTNYTGSSQAHNHGFSGSAHSHSINSHSHSINAHNHSFSGTAINLAVRYLDVIIAQKD
nr:hypothetical protein [uncultured Mediterranean phage uvMED]